MVDDSNFCLSHVLIHPAMCCALLAAVCVVAVDMLVYSAGQQIPAEEVPLLNNVIVSCLSTLLLLILRPGPPSTLSEILHVTVAGTLCGLGACLLLLAIIFDNPGNAISLYFTMPTFSTLFGFIIYNEKPRLVHIFLSFLAVAGVILVSGPTFLLVPSSIGELRTLYGLAMALTSAIVTSAGFVLVRRLSELHHTNPFIITLTSSLAGCIVSSALCAYFRSFTIPNTPAIALISFGNGFFSFVSYVMIFLALGYAKASYVTTAMTSEVLLSFIAQLLFFKIFPTYFSFAGAVMITVACVGLAFNDDAQRTKDAVENQGEPLLDISEN